MAELSKNSQTKFLFEKEIFKNWTASIFKITFTSNRADIKKRCYDVIVDMVEQATLTSSYNVDLSTFWNDVLTLAQKDFDALDEELRRHACNVIAKIPPLKFSKLTKTTKPVLDETFLISSKLDFFRRQPLSLRPTEFKLLSESLLSRDQSYKTFYFSNLKF